MGPARQRRGARGEWRSWQVGLRFGALTRAERGVGAGARDGPLGSSASAERGEWACAAGGPQEREESGSLRLQAVRGRLRRARAV